MKIAMLSTWDSKCGIFQYTKHLVDALTTDPDVSISLFCNNNIDERDTDQLTIYGGIFGVEWWGENPHFDIKTLESLVSFGNYDAFHVQYHSSLYRHPEFMRAMELIKWKNRDTRMILTKHDSSSHPMTSFDLFNTVIFHKPGIYENSKNGAFMEYPIVYTKPKIFSYGMGRNQWDNIRYICEDMSFDFDFHDSREHGWLQEEDLESRIKQADAVILWYNDVYPLVGASAAIRTAMGCYRHAFVNDIGWFRDVHSSKVTKFADGEELRIRLAEYFFPYAIFDSIGAIAEKHKELYRS